MLDLTYRTIAKTMSAHTLDGDFTELVTEVGWQ